MARTFGLDLRSAISALLTLGLLALYVFLVWRIVVLAMSCNTEMAAQKSCEVIQPRTSEILSTVQGLVSTLVVAVLAVSVPGKPLNLPFLRDTGDKLAPIAQWIAVLYVCVWLLAGAIAFVYGNFLLQDPVAEIYRPLIDLGSSWFGIAIAAAYAFLGIKPSS